MFVCGEEKPHALLESLRNNPKTNLLSLCNVINRADLSPPVKMVDGKDLS
jgi:hypothetical protein